MAEAFGAVVSGIGLLSLSTGLLDDVIRLKRLYGRMKDAPALLEDVAFELETISLLLRDLEKHRQQDSHDGPLMDRCISRCAEKTRMIKARIDMLGQRLQKHSGLGRAGFALTHKELQSFLDDLERWKSSIVIAFM